MERRERSPQQVQEDKARDLVKTFITWREDRITLGEDSEIGIEGLMEKCPIIVQDKELLQTALKGAGLNEKQCLVVDRKITEMMTPEARRMRAVSEMTNDILRMIEATKNDPANAGLDINAIVTEAFQNVSNRLS